MLSGHKRSIALEFLRSAIYLYDKAEAFYSAFHLAAAADEILGNLVDYATETQSDDVKEGYALRQQISIERELAAIFGLKSESVAQIRFRIVKPKNYIKHFNRPKEEQLIFDAKTEAKEALLRAISNLDIVSSDTMQDIEDFERRILEAELDEAANEIQGAIQPR